MIANLRRSAVPLITTIQKLFSEDLAKENDFLRQENKILRSKLGKRVPLTEVDRRTLVRHLEQPAPLASVRCDATLGGLLNHYNYAEKGGGLRRLSFYRVQAARPPPKARWCSPARKLLDSPRH